MHLSHDKGLLIPASAKMYIDQYRYKTYISAFGYLDLHRAKNYFSKVFIIFMRIYKRKSRIIPVDPSTKRRTCCEKFENSVY